MTDPQWLENNLRFFSGLRKCCFSNRILNLKCVCHYQFAWFSACPRFSLIAMTTIQNKNKIISLSLSQLQGSRWVPFLRSTRSYFLFIFLFFFFFLNEPLLSTYFVSFHRSWLVMFAQKAIKSLTESLLVAVKKVFFHIMFN